METCINCNKPVRVKSRGLCDSHYQRYKADHPTEFINEASRFCSVCETKHYARGLCRKHYLIYTKEGIEFPDPEFYKPNYRKAHRKVVSRKGKASDHLCACGCGLTGQEWALKPGAVGTLCDPQEKNCRYSLNIDDYQPMTILCHRRMDKRSREG